MKVEIPHPGIDTKRVTATAREDLADVAKTYLLASAHIDSWPHPSTVAIAEVYLIAYDTKRAGAETLEVLRAELGRWIANGPNAVVFAKAKILHDGRGARIELDVVASDVRSPPSVGPIGNDPVRCANCIANNLRPGECPICSASPRDELGRRVAPEHSELPDARLAAGDSFGVDVGDRIPDPNDDVPIEQMSDAQKKRLLQREVKIDVKGGSNSGRKIKKKGPQSSPGRPTIEDDARSIARTVKRSTETEETLRSTGYNDAELMSIFARAMRDRTVALVNGVLQIPAAGATVVAEEPVISEHQIRRSAV